MHIHLKNCHPPVEQNISIGVATQRLPFTLLPKSTWDIQDVIEHYRALSKKLPAGLHGSRIDWSRLEKIKMLSPAKCYIGKDSWLGYVVFEFAGTERVVLECPIEGNATYLISGDWKAMIVRTKAEIRHEFADRYTKLVHRGDWFSRVRAALRDRRS
ncbi:MAG: putative phage protein [Candidatus Sulfotelmatobacter sp.]|nr:putative phage protein [Candidatus Sulfotelmatobacter sp.]